MRRACLADGEIDVEASLDCVADWQAERQLDGVDVAIVGQRAGESSAFVRAMLQERPMLRVMLIELADAHAVLWELRPEQTRLGPVSPTEIVRAVHDDEAHVVRWATLTQTSGRGEA